VSEGGGEGGEGGAYIQLSSSEVDQTEPQRKKYKKDSYFSDEEELD